MKNKVRSIVFSVDLGILPLQRTLFPTLSHPLILQGLYYDLVTAQTFTDAADDANGDDDGLYSSETLSSKNFS